MRLVVVGLGQAGGRIADEFARLGKRAVARRSIQIITGAYAVNTDQADLTGLRTIKADFHHRILIGGGRTSGHGVGKINEVGAAVATNDGYKLIDAVRTGSRFYETDAFLLVAAAGGGTGSGAMPIFVETIKERYPHKPVYALAVLPFEHEERTEERCIYNVATCLKSTYAVADAVIVVDNQRFLKKDAGLVNNLERINQEIVNPFFDLLCAGEEVKRKHIGAKVVDAGDIMQTLEGWTAIGCGKSELAPIRLPFERTRTFRQKGRETQRGLEAVDQAISELSVSCNLQDAGKALSLLSAPPKEMNVALAREMAEIMRDMSPDAIIRSGDYPRERNDVSITLVLSALRDVPKVRSFFQRLKDSAATIKRRKEEAEEKLKEMETLIEDVPWLLQDR